MSKRSINFLFFKRSLLRSSLKIQLQVEFDLRVLEVI